MALKPTIYKWDISLSDMDRNHYDSLKLTVALHPSETRERMMARLLAYCINAEERLIFSRGLSATDEPDIWARTLDDRISLWIDVGEPSLDRIRKASRIAAKVKIYSFNTKSAIWWGQLQSECQLLPVEVFQFQWEDVRKFASLVDRTMTMSVSISDDTAYVTSEKGEVEMSWVTLQYRANSP